MGESDRYQDYRKLKKNPFSLGQDNNALMALFTLNIIFFLLLLTIQVGYYFISKHPNSTTHRLFSGLNYRRVYKSGVNARGRY